MVSELKREAATWITRTSAGLLVLDGAADRLKRHLRASPQTARRAVHEQSRMVLATSPSQGFRPLSTRFAAVATRQSGTRTTTYRTSLCSPTSRGCSAAGVVSNTSSIGHIFSVPEVTSHTIARDLPSRHDPRSHSPPVPRASPSAPPLPPPAAPSPHSPSPPSPPCTPPPKTSCTPTRPPAARSST